MKRLTNRFSDGEAFIPMQILAADGLQAIADKLADYEDLEEQGLLLRLPCKVGGKIYDIKCGYVRETTVSRYDMAEVIPYRTTVKAHIHARINGFHKSFLVEDIGKTVFLTKEEAEQALAETKGV